MVCLAKGMPDTPPLMTVSPTSATLLSMLRDEQPRTRAQLARLTGMGRSAVADRLNELHEAELVSPAGEQGSSGGRPPSTFAFDPGGGVALAVDLGMSHSRYAVTDLAGNLLRDRGEPVDLRDGPEAVLDHGHDVLAELLKDMDIGMERVVGVGLGFPGPIVDEDGRASSPASLPDWDQYAIADRLSQSIERPVTVERDVNAMALGEHTSAYPTVSDMMYVKVGSNVSAGIIAGGRLQSGTEGAAGTMGHIPVPQGPDVQCWCGHTGCLDAVASGQALISELAGKGHEVHHINDIGRMVQEGNSDAMRAVRRAGKSIGTVLAMCVDLLNPAVVVIGGGLSQTQENLTAGIREALYGNASPLSTRRLRVESTRTKRQGAILGASSMAINRWFDTLLAQ